MWRSSRIGWLSIRFWESISTPVLNFREIYSNFAYIDSHGGSGKVLLDGKQTDGSPLIAATQLKSFPCHITEINEESYRRLEESCKGISHVHPQRGDCNVLVPQILKSIDSWKFCLCFVDPDGFVYYNKGEKLMQLTSQTIDCIANSKEPDGPKTELLLNFQISSILRVKGFPDSRPDDERTPLMEEDITALYGCEHWKTLGDRRELLDHFIDERLRPYEFKGSFLVEDNGHPLYYLIYATHNRTGAKIMSDVMRKEYGQMLLREYPPNRYYFD